MGFLSDLRHFVEGDVLKCVLGCGDIALQVRGVHVGLKSLARFPCLIKHEMRRVVVILMERVVQAACFGAGRDD